MCFLSLFGNRELINENISSHNKPSALGASVLFCILLGFSILSVVHLILVYFAITLNKINEKKRFLQITLIKSGWLINVVLTLFLLSFMMNIYDEGIEMRINQPSTTTEESTAPASGVEEVADRPSTKPGVSMSTFFMENVAKLLLSVSVLFGIILMKTILIDGLNFKMLFKNYEARIQRNYEDSRILDLLNRITGKKILSDVEKWAIFVFKTISPDKDVVELQTLEYFFGTEDAKKIFDRFHICGDGRLMQEGFVLVYQEILNEERGINMGMSQKVSIVNKLDLVLCCVLIPIGFVVMTSILSEEAASIVGSVPIQLSTLLPFSFIFGPIVAEVTKSLVFVFLVEVFDIGDKILIGGSLHEVSDIGLMCTSNEKVSVLQNSKIMEKQIGNLREAKISKRSFEFTFSNSSEFKEKVEDLN